MKRASSGLFLLVAFVAGVALIGRLGLFKRSAPAAPPPLIWPRSPHLHNPAALIAAPAMGIRHVPPARSEKAAPPLSQAEATETLNDWTYPGAVINGNDLGGPGSSKKD